VRNGEPRASSRLLVGHAVALVTQQAERAKPVVASLSTAPMKSTCRSRRVRSL
jgi:hypothetical protein